MSDRSRAERVTINKEFDSFDAFSHLVLKHHKKLKEPCLPIVDVVIDHIREEIIPKSLTRIMAFDTYPDLKEAGFERLGDLIAANKLTRPGPEETFHHLNRPSEPEEP